MAFFRKRVKSSEILKKHSDYQNNNDSTSSNSSSTQEKKEYNEKIVSVSDWIVTILICCFPLVNILFLLIWALGSKDISRSKTNFARAALLIFLIIFAFIMFMLESVFELFSDYIYHYLLT